MLLDGVNDGIDQAQALCRLLKAIPCKINLIPYNPHDGASFRRPSGNRVERFFRILSDAGFTVVKRTTRGDDIAAACGQLAGQVKNRLERVASRQI